MLIRKYLDQNAPSLQDFEQLIESYKLEYGVILLRDYKKLLKIYNTTEMSLNEFKIHTNYILQYIWEKLHTGHWKNVHICWRILYSSIKLLIVLYYLYKSNEFNNHVDDDDPNSYHLDLDHNHDHHNSYHPFIELIKELDLSLIMGYPIFNQFASKLASKLHHIIMMKTKLCNEDYLSSRLFQLDNHDHNDNDHDNIDRFIQINEEIKINLNKLDRINCPSIELFNHLIKLNKPFIITNAINFWPAYNNNNNNNHINNKCKWTLNYWLINYGYRLVPIEIGKKYTEENWGQKLMTINDFINYYFNPSIINNNHNENTIKIGYLAQYDIFKQIPELENDIYIPDYCYVTGENEQINNNDINTIETNIWFGPKNTISPLHHDNDRANLLTQINGYKLIILYSSLETNNLYPYFDNMLCNTSRIDLDNNIDFNKFPKFKNAHGYYSILKHGEMLYIPPRCWHYVRSLTASYSVNFWWNISSSLIPAWE